MDEHTMNRLDDHEAWHGPIDQPAPDCAACGHTCPNSCACDCHADGDDDPATVTSIVDRIDARRAEGTYGPDPDDQTAAYYRKGRR